MYLFNCVRLSDGLVDGEMVVNVCREMAGFEKSQILSDLSERETEVLEALCQGMSNKEIAEVMFVTTETVKSHVSTIISKFGVKDRTQVVIASIRAGM